MRAFPFSDLLDGLPTIKVVDIGAAPVEGGEDAYAAIVRRGLARVVGFEPIEEACDALNEEARGKHIYLPLVVGDGEDATFYRCADPALSSVFAPDVNAMALFQTLEDASDVVEQYEVETVRLDDIEEAEGADYLRIGIQGGAGVALAGAERTLGHAVVVHIRAEFVPLYVDQPLFGEVDEVLRAFGFEFHKFVGLGGRTFKPLVAGDNENAALSQFLWADAVYAKDFANFTTLPEDRLLKLAVILHEVYRSFDLAALAIKHHDAKTDAGLWPTYIKRLTTDRPPRSG
ncbi:MAG: FkbM family methyltransferase [Alphaproteobacteria bacterium]